MNGLRLCRLQSTRIYRFQRLRSTSPRSSSKEHRDSNWELPGKSRPAPVEPRPRRWRHFAIAAAILSTIYISCLRSQGSLPSAATGPWLVKEVELPTVTTQQTPSSHTRNAFTALFPLSPRIKIIQLPSNPLSQGKPTDNPLPNPNPTKPYYSNPSTTSSKAPSHHNGLNTDTLNRTPKGKSRSQGNTTYHFTSPCPSHFTKNPKPQHNESKSIVSQPSTTLEIHHHRLSRLYTSS